MTTGDTMTAQQAAHIGLVHYAVPVDELDASVTAMAERLARGPQDAIRWSKTTANIGLRQLAHSMIDASMAYVAVTLHSPSLRRHLRIHRRPDAGLSDSVVCGHQIG